MRNWGLVILMSAVVLAGGPVAAQEMASVQLAYLRALTQQARYDDALGVAGEILQGTPDSAEALTLRARAYFGLGRFDLALADLNRAVQLQPGYAPAYAERARVRLAMSRGDAPLAKADWHQAQAAATLALRRGILCALRSTSTRGTPRTRWRITPPRSRSTRSTPRPTPGAGCSTWRRKTGRALSPTSPARWISARAMRRASSSAGGPGRSR